MSSKVKHNHLTKPSWKSKADKITDGGYDELAQGAMVNIIGCTFHVRLRVDEKKK